MSEFRRSLMMKVEQGGGGGLPSGYTECEYLESNSTQKHYINTLIYNNSLIDVYIKWAGTLSGTQCLLGERISNATIYFIGCDQGYTLYSGYGTQRVDKLNKLLLNTIYEFEIKNHVVYVDGIAQETYNPLEYTTTNELYILRYNGMLVGSNARIYEVVISQEGNVLRKFVPALDENGKPCMYDMVSRVPFYNQSNGEFGYKTIDGTIVEPT